MKFVPTKVKMIMPSVDVQKVRNFSMLVFFSSGKIGNAGKEWYSSVFVVLAGQEGFLLPSGPFAEVQFHFPHLASICEARPGK